MFTLSKLLKTFSSSSHLSTSLKTFSSVRSGINLKFALLLFETILRSVIAFNLSTLIIFINQSTNNFTSFNMQYFTAALTLALLPSVLAYDYGSSDSTPATTTPAAQKAVSGVHIVKVGQNGLSFEPNTLDVPVGESVSLFPIASLSSALPSSQHETNKH